MRSHDTELNRIKELLREHPKGMKITRIAGEISMNRNSVAKYLDILLMTHQVEMLQHGMSKIYRLSRRTSIPTMLDLSSDFIIVLDGNSKIVQVNDNFLAFAGLDGKAVLGMHSASPNLPVVSLPAVVQKITEARHGRDLRTEIRVARDNREFCFSVRITPVVFPDGKPGMTIVLEDITEQKKKEAALKESEADFRTLFGVSPIGTAVCDSSGQLIDANAAFLDIFRVGTPDEIRFLNLFALPGIPPGSLAALKNGEKVMFESILDFDRLKAQNQYFTNTSGKASFELQVAPINLKRGSLTGYLVQLHESDSRIRNIMDNVQDFIARFSHDLRYLSVNRGMEELTGIAPEAFVGRTSRELGIPDNYADLWNRGVLEVFRTGRPSSCDFSIRSGGEFRSYRTNLAPEIGRSEEIVSVIAVTRDVTPAADKGPVREDSQSLLVEILSCIDEAVILLDVPSCTISFANEAAKMAYGYKEGGLFEQIPGVYPGNFAIMEEAFKKAGYYETETMARNGDGGRHPVQQHIRPMYGESGGIRSLVVIIREVASRPGHSLPVRHHAPASRNLSDSL